MYLQYNITNKQNMKTGVKGMAKAIRSDIKNFLTQVRQTIKNKNGFHLEDREKNMKALINYNIPIDSVKYYIEYLEVEHYSKGPEPDDQDEYDHDWWFFGREIDKNR